MLHGAVVSAVLCVCLLRAASWPLSPGAATPRRQLRSDTHVLLASSHPTASSAARVTRATSNRTAPVANASERFAADAARSKQDYAVHVAYTATARVLPAVLRSMLSLSLHSSAPHLVIHLFVPESDMQAASHLSQCFQQQLAGAGLSGGMPELLIDQIRPMPIAVNYQHWQKYGAAGAQARLFLHEWLLQVHRLLYLDGDTLVLGDVAELYAKPMSYLVAAAPDILTLHQNYGSRCPDLDRVLDASQYGLQNGVMLMDLDRWRSEDMTGLMKGMMSTYPCSNICDQLVLNAVLQPRGYDRLGYDWNKIAANSVSDLFRHKIVHFAGPDKPWDGTDHLFESASSFFETFRTQWKPQGSTADDGGHCAGFPL